MVTIGNFIVMSKRPISGEWLNVHCCLWGWYYDKKMGWVACAEHNDDLFYKQPTDHYINYWITTQPQLYELDGKPISRDIDKRFHH